MVAYTIGCFLTETGRITKEQFKDVLEKQDEVRVKLGLIAVSEGLMTMEQVEEVNRLQSIMDKRFGDIALGKGYLTDRQVGNLLKQQGNEYLTFVQTLIDEGIADLDTVEAWVKAFQKENGFTNSEIEALKSGDLENIVRMYLPLEGIKYEEHIGIAIKTIIRFIDRNVCLEKGNVMESGMVRYPIVQRMEGNPNIFTAFAGDSSAVLAVARTFAKEEFTKVDNDSADAVAELLNWINGLFASAMSQRDVGLELLPPSFGEEKEQIVGKELCIIPICVKEQKIYFIVSDKTVGIMKQEER